MTETPPTTPPAEGENYGRASLLDLALVLTSNIRFLVAVPLTAGLLGVAGSFLMTPVFTSTTVMTTPQKSDSAATALLGSLAGLATSAGLGSVKSPADQWVGLLRSRTIADALVDQFKLVERYRVDYRFEARKELRKFTDIEVGKDGLITLSVDDTDPKVAASIATGYVAELTKLTKSIAVTEAGQRRLFFEQQVAEAKKNLDNAAQALEKAGIGAGVLKTDPGAAVELVAKLRAQIAAAEIRTSVMQENLTENNIELRDSVSQLRSLRAQLASIEKAGQPGSASSGEYVGRYRDFKYYEELFELLAKQYELAKVDEAREGAVIQVVDTAEIPEWKSKPRRAVIGVVFAAVGFILTFLFLMTRQAIRNSRQDPIAASKISRIPLLNRL